MAVTWAAAATSPIHLSYLLKPSTGDTISPFPCFHLPHLAVCYLCEDTSYTPSACFAHDSSLRHYHLDYRDRQCRVQPLYLPHAHLARLSPCLLFRELAACAHRGGTRLTLRPWADADSPPLSGGCNVCLWRLTFYRTSPYADIAYPVSPASLLDTITRAERQTVYRCHHDYLFSVSLLLSLLLPRSRLYSPGDAHIPTQTMTRQYYNIWNGRRNVTASTVKEVT